MKKRYTLKYSFTGGERVIDFTNPQEFSLHLDAILEDPHVLQHTIDFYTEEVEV